MITFQWKKKRCAIRDASAVEIPQKKSGYVQIKETKRTFFFWCQETDYALFSKAIVELQKVLDGQQIQAIDTTAPSQVLPIYTIKNGKMTIADVSLRRIIDTKALSLMCPPNEVDGKTHDELIQVVINNIHSNQFQETLRLIESAITSGEGDEICLQCGAELHHQGFGGVRLILLDIINKYKQ
ncbi:Pru domain-containing protein [Entamoeba marina]